MLLVTITVDTVDYHVATDSYQGDFFYYPFVASMPVLEIGPQGSGGLIGVRLGNIALTRDASNPDHPFGVDRFNKLISEPGQYLCKIVWSKTKEVLHDGTIGLANVSDQILDFTLTDPIYEQELKRYAITEKWFFVEDVLAPSGGGPYRVKVSGHEFVVGMRVVFAEMTGPGSELQYNQTDDNWFIVGSVTSDEIGIYTKDFSPLTAGVTTGTPVFDNGTADGIPKNRIGVPAYVPFCHGTVFHKTPVVRRSNQEVANPNLIHTNPSFPLEVYEDGVLIGTNDPSSPEAYTKAPTDEVIYLNSPMADGKLSICGRARSGGTINELFRHFSGLLGLGFDDSKA